MTSQQSRASPVYYLLPVVLFLPGGFAGYFLLRRRDPARARDCMLIGVGMTVAGLLGLSAAQLMSYPDFESVPEPDMDRMPLGGLILEPVVPDEPIEGRSDGMAGS